MTDDTAAWLTGEDADQQVLDQRFLAEHPAPQAVTQLVDPAGEALDAALEVDPGHRRAPSAWTPAKQACSS